MWSFYTLLRVSDQVPAQKMLNVLNNDEIWLVSLDTETLIDIEVEQVDPVVASQDTDARRIHDIS